MLLRTFKDILVFDSFADFVKRQNNTLNLAYMMQCLDGQAELVYDEKNYTLSQDDVLFSKADLMPHIISKTKNFKCKVFATDAHSLTDIVFACLREENDWLDKMRYLLANPIIHLSKSKVRIIQSYRDLVHFYTEEEGFYKKKVAYLQAQAIVFELLSWVDETMHLDKNGLSPIASHDKTPTAVNERYWQFQKLLVENYTKERHVSWYAEQMHITPAYLNKLCVDASGFAPQSIIYDMVLKEAKRLLLVTSKNIKEIAFLLNFPSESNFCKFFREKIGVSPAVYRKSEMQ